MIKHNNIIELLKGVKFEWKTLGEVAELRRGRVISKEDLAKNIGYYPVYSSQTAKNGEIGRINTFDFDGEFVNWTTDGANAGTVFYRKGKFSITNVSGLIKLNNSSKLNYKFLFYWLSIEAKKHVYSGMGNPKLMSNQVEKILIPIPPLHIQTEIVRILDTFTALTAELTAELTTELTERQKQYNYYRDKLLTFKEDEVEWKALENITLPTSNIKWKETDRAYKYIDLTSVSRETKSIIGTTEIRAINAPSRAQKVVEENDVIFATTRPTLQRFTLIEKEFSENIASTGYCVLRANRNYILPKWIYYNISSTRFNNYVNENQSGTAYPSISDAKVKQFKIPTPPLKEQTRIVEILDKFDALTNSITEGLPREIELRQKQYKYYRNLLLDFPKVQE